MARKISSQPRRRAGTFTAHARPRGERETDSTTLGWFDCDDGRYAVLTTAGTDGRKWINYLAADNTKLIERLTELLASVDLA